MYRFGFFEVDPDGRTLSRKGVPVKLQDQPLKVLCLLLERPREIVTRDELRRALWPEGTYVEFDGSLNAALNRLRSALGDDADNPRFIETVPKCGYRFIAPVESPSAFRTDLIPLQRDADRGHSGETAAEMEPSVGESLWRQRSRVASRRIAAVAKASPLRYRLVPIVSAVVLFGLAANVYFFFHRALPRTEKDSIVIDDFTNKTGDPVFDGTLRQGLAAQLGQTPFLNIVSDDQIATTLRLMEKPPDARLTQDVAREVCERANAGAVIDGSIAALGNQYAIGLNAINCRTGATLAEEQVTADSKEKVLSALGRAASELRSKLGESAASLQRYDVPLDQVTTQSIEALQAWGLGSRALVNEDYPSAISSLQRAVDIDPNFAQAYSTLGITYYLLGQSHPAAENISKAYDLRNRASEREKFSISCNYNLNLTGDFEKAAQICGEWTKVFPRDPPSFIGLAGAYLLSGRSEALAAQREALRLDPTAYSYQVVARISIGLGQYDEARTTIQQGEANHIDPSVFRLVQYQIAFLQGDPAGMAKQLTGPWAASPAEVDLAQADTAAYYGHLAHARELTARAIEAAKRLHAEDTAAAIEVHSAAREALFGNLVEARKTATEALNGWSDWHVQGPVASVFSLAGDAAKAQKLTDELIQRFPTATLVQFNYLPAIRALAALGAGNRQKVIEQLGDDSPYELAPGSLGGVAMLPTYIRGQVYLEVHEGSQAAAEFQKILDHRGVVLNAPVGALAHLGLARAYALQGDTAKATAAYEDFLALWKDADPNIPILRQARAEYAKLQ